jgi:hypothetical protein
VNKICENFVFVYSTVSAILRTWNQEFHYDVFSQHCKLDNGMVQCNSNRNFKMPATV